MRYLTFDSTDPNSVVNYEILYQGLVGTNRTLTRPETRIMSKILDKFENIGKPEVNPNGATFALSKSGGISLEDVEYDLITECLASVPWKSRAARRVDQAMTWFESIQESQVPEVGKTS